MTATNPRPFAKRARELCPESDAHHERVWFCQTCRALESRLAPFDQLPGVAELLEDAGISVEYRAWLT